MCGICTVDLGTISSGDRGRGGRRDDRPRASSAASRAGLAAGVDHRGPGAADRRSDSLPVARRNPDQRADEGRAERRSTLRFPGRPAITSARRRCGGAHWAPFALAQTVNHLDPTSGNSARLAADSNAAIDEMVADVDAARETVHGCFYIWLADNNGLKLKDAFIRAAQARREGAAACRRSWVAPADTVPSLARDAR